MITEKTKYAIGTSWINIKKKGKYYINLYLLKDKKKLGIKKCSVILCPSCKTWLCLNKEEIK